MDWDLEKADPNDIVNSYKSKQSYQFSDILDPTITQEAVFNRIALSLIDR